MAATHLLGVDADSLPEGVTPDLLRIIECPVASFEALDVLPDNHPVLTAGLCEASPPMVSEDQHPTIMKVTAWMVHEGVNRNRQGFVKDELAAIAPTLFREPNFGVMDFNHSAFRPFSDEPKVIGIWHAAEFLFDEQAQRWGILASGVMFSWLFPDHADTLLADQERLGHMRFSMSAIPASVELGRDAEGPFEILHNPVFMTVSALDVKPADADALGRGSEAVDETATTLRERLLAVASAHPWQPQPAAPTEDTMDNKDMIELAEAKARLEADIAGLKEQLETAETALAAAEQAGTEAAEAAALKVTELEGVNETLKGQVAELTEQLTTVTTERDALLEFKTDVEAKAEASAAAEVLEARLNTLPKKFVEALAKKSEDRQTALKTKIAGMTDEEFTMYREDELGFGEVELSFLERSRREGLLDTADADDDKMDVAGKVRKLLNS